MEGESESTQRSWGSWLALAGGPLAAIVVMLTLSGLSRAGYLSQPLAAGPKAALEEAELPREPLAPNLIAMAGVATLMAVWWLTEVVPMAATALIPLAVFPLCGILPPDKTALCYGDKNIFLYLGGFLVALAVEESGLHRRVALAIVAQVGDSPARVVLGFMLSTGLLSMWLSNTATTLMMLPIALSILVEAETHSTLDAKALRNFGISLCLAVAYAASIGGMGTKVGTPTNLIFFQVYEKNFQGETISFSQWMLFSGPLVVVFLLVSWFVIARLLFPMGSAPLLGGSELIRDLRAKLGPLRPYEFRVGVVFGLTALMWIIRDPLLKLIGNTSITMDDSTIAILAALACFLIPSEGTAGRPLLTWKDTVRVPWGILLLFGGGLALASGMGSTHLDNLAGEGLGRALVTLPYWGMILLVAAGMTFLSEITSNVACAQMVLPILATVAKDQDLPPIPLMVAATLAASCGFMLPVATPPNAIAYGTGRMKVRDMARAGIWMNLIGIGLITLTVLMIRV